MTDVSATAVDMIAEEDPFQNDGDSDASETVSRVEDEQAIDEQEGNHSKELKNNGVRAAIISMIILVMGAAASACFFYLGLSSARNDESDNFDRRASDLSKEIVSSMRDYEMAALWIHEACHGWREGNYTRDDFLVLYNYIVSGGLDFYMAEWVPNISSVERPDIEQEAAEYWADVSYVDYQGIVGLGPNPEDGTQYGIFNRSEQPFYFPVHFFEPRERIGIGAHLDLYSLPYERAALELALQEFEPVLTERFEIVSKFTNGYSVSMVHPGIPLPGSMYRKPRDLALLLIHIRSFLERASRFQSHRCSVFLFDATKTISDGSLPEDFLGGVDVDIVGPMADRKLMFHDTGYTLDDVQNRGGLYYEERIMVGTRTWTISVIPLDENDYDPDITFAILAGVMIFAASVLLTWIWIINHRNRSRQVHKIINEAAAESALVSSLYPAAVRERLIHMTSTANPSGKKHDESGVGNYDGKRSVTDFSESDKVGGFNDGSPIAELYPATTVLFADLTGFTRWSSTRSPTQVFQLLETIYGAFDSLAERRKVFKVETIGDCYVAVTGLPKPQEEHAVIMVRFARDCLIKMPELLSNLADYLGEDTLTLELRIGIHSGPVTGGVLRGPKSRFQLFGDTMNTASRIESNGERGRIHVSQQTAEELVKRGKGHLLIPRKDKVVAKGKGELQTFLVHYQGTTKAFPDSTTNQHEGLPESSPHDQIDYLLQMSRNNTTPEEIVQNSDADFGEGAGTPSDGGVSFTEQVSRDNDMDVSEFDPRSTEQNRLKSDNIVQENDSAEPSSNSVYERAENGGAYFHL
ncbi:hypothetical protein ACA910_002930 [Epithemia clementina (nom. ined.)]